MASNDNNSHGHGRDVPLFMESGTFENQQDQTIKDMEKNFEDKANRKREEWEHIVEIMKDEFLDLYPSDLDWEQEPPSDSILKRRGSSEYLDLDRMKTLFLEYPDGPGYIFKIRFNVASFERESVQVTNDGGRIFVRAIKKEMQDDGLVKEREYIRKIDKPKNVNLKKLNSSLTQDGVLILEAPIPSPINNEIAEESPSELDAQNSTSQLSAKSESPSGTPESPPPPQQHKYGIAQFIGGEGEKVLSLMVDIGTAFKANDIILQVCKDNVIQIKAKKSVKTTNFMSKHKFFKEFELGEKIEILSLRGGLTENGKLLVAALGKGHPLFNKEEFKHAAHGNINNIPCNILELAEFPIIHQVLGNGGKIDNLDK